ncbi:hypothetical protein, partial [Escherichia coli]|uniref:GntT/GntP/DsdX family permease n=1 Tax=Escherichia coli TaxID=562 RepID=UPI003EE29387
DKIAATMEKGMGGTLGFLAVVVALGAMFGKILHESEGRHFAFAEMRFADVVRNMQLHVAADEITPQR